MSGRISTSPGVIVVDTREPPGVVDFTRTAAPTYERRTLPTGDFAWEARNRLVLVERKTLTDLCASLIDGRWQSQVARLTESADLPIALIQQGDAFNFPGWSWQGIDTALFVAQMGGLLLCRYVEGELEKRILALYSTTQQEQHASLVRPRRKIIAAGPEETAALSLLAALPGSGPTTARKLLNEYHTAAAALDAIRSGACGTVRDSVLRRWQAALGFDTYRAAAA